MAWIHHKSLACEAGRHEECSGQFGVDEDVGDPHYTGKPVVRQVICQCLCHEEKTRPDVDN